MKLPHCLLVAAFIPAVVSSLYADSIQYVILPNTQTSAVGNDDSGPLNGSFATGQFQDIWSSSQFPSEPILLSDLAFRLKPNTGSILATVTSAAISLSTTTASPLTLSTTFASNRGPDFTQVFSLTGTLLNSPGCTGSNPCPFDMVFTFNTPFLYDPSKGNLAIEIAITGFSGTGTGRFDVQSFASNNSPIGEVTAVSGSPGPLQTGDVEYSDSVTRLGYTVPSTATPEPKSGALLLSVLGLIAFAAKRRARTV